jgi:hypothetical protein
MPTLFKAEAGTWPNVTGNSNLVPVVADGKVFVASHDQVGIFGLTSYPTTTVLTSSPNPSNYGQLVTLTAQVSTAGPPPTGYVTFKNGTTFLTRVAVNASGVATLGKTTLPVGSDSLTAAYLGRKPNLGSTSAAVTQVVNQATTTMSLTSTPNPSPSGASVKFTATFKSNGGWPTGTVTFSSAGTTLGTATIRRSGGTDNATFSTTTLPVGSDVVTATYPGSADHSAATASVTQVVK